MAIGLPNSVCKFGEVVVFGPGAAAWEDMGDPPVVNIVNFLSLKERKWCGRKLMPDSIALTEELED